MTSPHHPQSNAPNLSLVCGILSLVFLGPIFGPLAIWQSGKAPLRLRTRV